jgi:hypothetical protein
MKIMRVLRIVLLLALAGSPAAAQDRWFHVRVNHQDGSENEVSINLPLGVVTAALSAAPANPCRARCRMELGGARVTMGDLRRVNAHLETYPAGGVAVIREGVELRFRREGGELVTAFDQHCGKSGEIRMPAALASALSSGPNQSANLRAAAAYLQTSGAGEILLVGADDSNVRMWVDADPSGRRSW